MKNFVILGVFAVLLAACTPPEVEVPQEEPEQEIIPLNITLPPAE